MERVLWVVAGVPPHKPDEPVSPLEQRLAMVEAAIAGNPAFEASPADIDRPGPHYAVGTLRWLAERQPGLQFAYLMGADSLRDLPTWHTPREFVQACSLLGVMRRPDVHVNLPALEAQVTGLSAKVRYFEAPLVDLSGHGIRRRVRAGHSIRYLVPQAVAEIIQRQGLYR